MNAVKRASKSAEKDKKRKAPSESDSDDSDSDVLVAKMNERDRKRQLKHELKKKQDQEAAILKQLDEQTAKNARRLKELADARNNYPVIFYMIFELSLTNQISCRL